MKKKLLIGTLFATVLLALGLIWTFAMPQGEHGAKAIEIQIKSERDHYDKTYQYDTDAEFLGDLLVEKKLVTAPESAYGRFITEAGGLKADEANQYWWSLSVNGTMAMVGMDEIPLADGDHYTIELKQGY